MKARLRFLQKVERFGFMQGEAKVLCKGEVAIERTRVMVNTRRGEWA